MRLLPSCLALGLLASSLAAQLPANPPLAVDVNPDPDIVEVFLEASVIEKQYLAGATTSVWAYNGTIPGPTIEAKVGDTLIVHFTNNLPEETTIHWHGLEVPADMDGSHISQLPVPANGGTFDYEFELLTGSFFWYHPHVRTNEQVERGLYGGIMVRDPAVEGPLGLPTTERILFLDDVLLDKATHQLVAFNPSNPVEKVANILNGRLGNAILVNGEVLTFDGETALPILENVTNGAPERWRLVNASNVRFFRLSWDAAVGEEQAVWRIGGDGGLIEAPIPKPPVVFANPGGGGDSADHVSSTDPSEGILLVNGERADVIWRPTAIEPHRVFLRLHDWHRGAHTVDVDLETGNIILGDEQVDGLEQPLELAQFLVSGPVDPTPYEPPAVLTTIDAIDPQDVVGNLVLTMGHTPPPLPPSGDVNLFIQVAGPGMPLPFPKVTSLQAFDVTVGDTRIWQVVNLTHHDHPFHTHGFFFQPFEVEFQDDIEPENSFVQPIDFVENKDVFRVPGRPRPEPFTSRAILRAYVKFDDTGREGLVRAEGQHVVDDGSAGWLAHCHIMEHSRFGMMTFFETRYPNQPFWLLGNGLAGENGIPKFRGVGPLTPGSPATLTLSNAKPSTFAVLWIGFSQLAAPFKQGILVPAPNLQFNMTTNPSGVRNLNGTWPTNIPAGTELWWQFWMVDPAGPAGVSASNALKTVGQ